MKPRVGGASRCFNAASAVGENFSGLLSRATIIVTSARTSRFKAARATSRSTVPFADSCSSWPISPIRSGVKASSWTSGVARPSGMQPAVRRCRQRRRPPAPARAAVRARARASATERRPPAAPAEPAASAATWRWRGRRRRGSRFGAARRRADHRAPIAARVVPRHHRCGQRTFGRRTSRRRRPARRGRLARLDQRRRVNGRCRSEKSSATVAAVAFGAMFSDCSGSARPPCWACDVGASSTDWASGSPPSPGFRPNSCRANAGARAGQPTGPGSAPPAPRRRCPGRSRHGRPHRRRQARGAARHGSGANGSQSSGMPTDGRGRRGRAAGRA